VIIGVLIINYFFLIIIVNVVISIINLLFLNNVMIFSIYHHEQINFWLFFILIFDIFKIYLLILLRDVFFVIKNFR
jgi:hypothetical protein